MAGSHNLEANAGVAPEAAAPFQEANDIEYLLAVAPKRAWRMLDCGATRGYQLIASGELASYVDGRSRRITMESIKAFIARRLAASGSGELRRNLVEPAVRAVKRGQARRQAADNIIGVIEADDSFGTQTDGRTKPADRRRARRGAVLPDAEEHA